jgi:O-antigen/teichoic acid export membrane protein
LPLLYGRAFAGSVLPLIVLLPGSAVLALHAVTRPALIQCNRPGVVSAAELYALGITLVILIVLLPRVGIVAASLASSLSYTASLGLQIYTLRRAGLRGVRPTISDVTWIVSRLLHGVERLPRGLG